MQLQTAVEIEVMFHMAKECEADEVQCIHSVFFF
jgi:hypothetical protein